MDDTTLIAVVDNPLLIGIEIWALCTLAYDAVKTETITFHLPIMLQRESQLSSFM